MKIFMLVFHIWLWISFYWKNIVARSLPMLETRKEIHVYSKVHSNTSSKAIFRIYSCSTLTVSSLGIFFGIKKASEENSLTWTMTNWENVRRQFFLDLFALWLCLPRESSQWNVEQKKKRQRTLNLIVYLIDVMK